MALDIPQTLPDWPNVTPRSIVADSFSRELEAYRHRQQELASTVWLSLPQLEDALQAGAVRFGNPDLKPKPVDDRIALRAAIEAVEDGIVMMFVDQCRIRDLDKALSLTSESVVRYLKLTALRGY